MWADIGAGLLEPLIGAWRSVRRLEREIVKDDGPPPPRCEFTRGRLWRKRRCSLDAFHVGEHRWTDL